MAYTVHCVHADRQDWAASLRAQLGEAVAGLDASASTVRVLDGYPAPAGRDPNSPAVVVYLGSPGSGQTAKLFNNALMMMNQANIADIVELAITLRVDPSSLVDVLKLQSPTWRMEL